MHLIPDVARVFGGNIGEFILNDSGGLISNEF